MPDITLPGYNYLGPGNPLHKGPPTNSADSIAREHDYAYYNAITKQDVYTADRQAIKKFSYDYITTGDTGDLLGAVGLSIKAAVEEPFGIVLYGMPSDKRAAYDVPWGYNRQGNPFYNYGNRLYSDKAIEKKIKEKVSMPNKVSPRSFRNRNRLSLLRPFNLTAPRLIYYSGNKPIKNSGDRRRSRSAEAGPSTSRLPPIPQADSEDEFDLPVAASTPQEMQADAPAPQGSSNNQSNSTTAGAPIVISNVLPDSQTIKFTRSRLFTSWANEYVMKVDEKKTHASMALPLAAILVELLMFYISPAEYGLLPVGSRVQEVNVTVTPVGSKVCFSTNEQNARWTNFTQTIFGMSAFGLNKTGYSTNTKITSRDASKVMKPTGFSACNAQKHWEARLLGDPAKHSDFASCMSTVRALPWYATWAVPGIERLNTYFPDLSQHVDMWEFYNMIGQPIHYHYKPRNGLIKNKKMININYENVDRLYNTYTNTFTAHIVSRINKDKGGVSLTNSDVNINRELTNYGNKLIDIYATSNMYGQMHNNTVQPSLHVGLQSVQANAPDDEGSTPEFVNACAYWKVDSEIIISYGYSCQYLSTKGAKYGSYGEMDFIPANTDQANAFYDNYHSYGMRKQKHERQHLPQVQRELLHNK